MQKTAMILAASLMAGSVALAPAPADAKGGKKTTAASASKTKPGYSNRLTKRPPARSAASVIKARAKAEAKAADKAKADAFKKSRKDRTKSSVKRQKSKGKSAKTVTKTAPLSMMARITGWIGGLFGAKPKAEPRKVQFRESKVSEVMGRLERTPSGNYRERNLS